MTLPAIYLPGRAGTASTGTRPATTAPAGVPAVAPAARPPLQPVTCRICGFTVSLVSRVPEPSGVCPHSTCSLCIAWLRAGGVLPSQHFQRVTCSWCKGFIKMQACEPEIAHLDSHGICGSPACRAKFLGGA